MNREIEISISLDERDIVALAEEYENNESSFVTELCERILERAADTTREMNDTATAINRVNPFGNIILREKEIAR